MARALELTLHALQAKYDEAMAARAEAEAEAKAKEHADAAAAEVAAEVAEAAAGAGATDLGVTGAACGAISGQPSEGADLRSSQGWAISGEPGHDGAAAGSPQAPPMPSAREIAEIQADRARNLAQASATRR
jgi:hypothetical protein